MKWFEDMDSDDKMGCIAIFAIAAIAISKGIKKINLRKGETVLSLAYNDEDSDGTEDE